MTREDRASLTRILTTRRNGGIRLAFLLAVFSALAGGLSAYGMGEKKVLSTTVVAALILFFPLCVIVAFHSQGLRGLFLGVLAGLVGTPLLGLVTGGIAYHSWNLFQSSLPPGLLEGKPAFATALGGLFSAFLGGGMGYFLGRFFSPIRKVVDYPILAESEDEREPSKREGESHLPIKIWEIRYVLIMALLAFVLYLAFGEEGLWFVMVVGPLGYVTHYLWEQY